MKTIAILAPMQEELDALARQLPSGTTETLHGLVLLHIDFAGHHLVLAKSGVGKVNTAMNATLLASHVELDAIINVGSSGGLREGQRILDLVEGLEEHDDVQHVYANFDIPDDLLKE